MFADRGIKIGITPGRAPDFEAFIFDEETGEITPNPEYNGVNILFDLPIDISLADPVKAQQYLDTLWGNGAEEDAATEQSDN